MARSKRLILEGVKDHIVPHIAAKNTAREMWVGLEKLYQGSSEQRKMYLEEKMRNTRMKKGERFDSLSHIQDNRDQLLAIGFAPRDSELVRLTLNSVSEDYQVFVQSILGREKLSGWEVMWAALQQEELRRDLLKIFLVDGSSSSKVKKEEEENTTLASKGN